jgi:hypothetical protein
MTPSRAGVRDGVGAAHGIKLVEKRTDVELRGAEPIYRAAER